jgi:acyl carrier protein phosphodiesterase
VNWLAHSVLAPQHGDGWLGSVLGDFVKGSLDTTGWPPAVVAAIRQHRAIDTWTDAHPEVLAAKARFAPGARRFAGVLLDLWFDHCLARAWARWQPGAGALTVFTARVNAALAHADLPDLPERFARVRAPLVRDDWLASYATRAGLREAIERMASRLRDGSGLRAALAQADADPAPLDAHFDRFWPQLVAQAPRWLSS